MQPMLRNILIAVAVILILIFMISWKTSAHIPTTPRALVVAASPRALVAVVSPNLSETDKDDDNSRSYDLQNTKVSSESSARSSEPSTVSQQRSKFNSETYEEKMEELWGSPKTNKKSSAKSQRVSNNSAEKHLDTGVALTEVELEERKKYEEALENAYQGPGKLAPNTDVNNLKKTLKNKPQKIKGKKKYKVIPTTSSTTSTTSTGEVFTISTTTFPTTEVPSLSDNTNGSLSRDIVHFEMDFQTSDSNLKEILQKRIARVRSMCQAGQSLQWDHKQKKATIMRQRQTDVRVQTFTSNDNKQSVQLCFIPKAGSSFWKSVFSYFETGDTLERKAAKSISINAWKNSKIFATDAPSMTTVRNPWKRLVSLFQQKIEKDWKSDKSPYHRYMCRVCHINKLTSPEKLSTFRHLVDCVLRLLTKQTVNRHWENVYNRCAVCSSNIEYIVRTENMMKEGAYVLEKAGFNNATEILNHVRQLTIRDVETNARPAPSSYYKDIPNELILKLADYWKPDLEMFGYPSTPFTD